MGPVRFQSETAMRVTVPGVSTGLAWSSVGGELLFIECTRYRGSGGLKLTGQLGDVMKESAQIALSWIRANTVELGLQEQSVFEEREPLFKFSDVQNGYLFQNSFSNASQDFLAFFEVSWCLQR